MFEIELLFFGRIKFNFECQGDAMSSNEFSTRLKQAMSEAGMNQADVIHSAAQHDKKLGKSQVSQYVSGKTTPRRDVMELLARILDVDAAWLSGNKIGRAHV